MPNHVAQTFELLVRNHLPHKLDHTSWPAHLIIAKFQEHIRSRGPRYGQGRLEIWQPWMGTPEARDEALRRRGPPPGLSAAANFVPFLGAGGEGRLVWRSTQFGVPVSGNAEQQQDDDRVRKYIGKLEHDLALLGCSIANYMAYWLLDYVLRPQVQSQRIRGLRFDHLIQAVKERLGDRWFDVPFDVENELRDWEEGPNLDLRRSEIAQVVRIRGSGYEFPE